MEAMVRTAESTTAVRPLRRTEILAERIRLKQEVLHKPEGQRHVRQVCHWIRQKMQETATG